MPGTDYTKNQETVYYGEFRSTTFREQLRTFLGLCSRSRSRVIIDLHRTQSEVLTECHAALCEKHVRTSLVSPLIPLRSCFRIIILARTFDSTFFSPFPLLLSSAHAEQEPTSSDPDSDEEADLVLSLETETGLLTNQHTKGRLKANTGK
jgi:hypothetical protein